MEPSIKLFKSADHYSEVTCNVTASDYSWRTYTAYAQMQILQIPV